MSSLFTFLLLALALVYAARDQPSDDRAKKPKPNKPKPKPKPKPTTTTKPTSQPQPEHFNPLPSDARQECYDCLAALASVCGRDCFTGDDDKECFSCVFEHNPVCLPACGFPAASTQFCSEPEFCPKSGSPEGPGPGSCQEPVTGQTPVTTVATTGAPGGNGTDPRLIMIGGDPYSSVGRLVEIFPPSSSLSIPSLPHSRRGHSLTLLPGPPARLVVCGGGGPGMDTDLSCISYTSGQEAWQEYYSLKQGRYFHSAAKIGPDSVMILGPGATAEIVPGGGQFDLQHDSYAACAIALEDTGEVVLIGGLTDEGDPGSLSHGHVSRYSSTGFLGSLPDLRQKRSEHACGAFKTQGLTVLLVTGGFGGSSFLSTTELFHLSTATAWTLAAPLPIAVHGLSAASLAGGLYVAGGGDGSSIRDEVFRYVQEDGEDDRWEEVGRMANSRSSFAMVEGNIAALSS